MGLENFHPTFYKELVEHGFIVNEGLNEFDEVKKLSEKIDNNPINYILTVNPTMGCNFKCWYCYETHVNGSKMQGGTIQNILKFMENEKANNPLLQYFSLSFFGGEPLLYFDQTVVPLLEGGLRIFKDSGIFFSSSFATNGFLIDQAKIDFFKAHAVTGFQITLDGNREYHNKTRFVNASRGSYDEIIHNIQLLAKNEMPVIMRINFTQENYLSCEDIPQDFLDLDAHFRKYITVDFHQVWQDAPLEQGTLWSILERFKHAGFDVSVEADSLNNVVDSCYADKHQSATINYNGEVFKCTARDFTSENSLGKLGEDGKIHWGPAYERRQSAKFHNKPCMSCKLLPICNGGCSQHAYEHLDSENGYCVFGFDEHRKNMLVLERFKLRTS
jgi:uncharacterized protein